MKSYQIRKRVVVLFAVILLITFAVRPSILSFDSPSSLRTLKDTLGKDTAVPRTAKDRLKSAKLPTAKVAEKEKLEQLMIDSRESAADNNDDVVQKPMKKEANVDNAVTALRGIKDDSLSLQKSNYGVQSSKEKLVDQRTVKEKELTDPITEKSKGRKIEELDVKAISATKASASESKGKMLSEVNQENLLQEDGVTKKKLMIAKEEE